MLVEYALAQLAARGATIQLVDLAALPAEPLLGRGATATVAEAIEAATRAGIIVAGTPVYRATYKIGRASCRERGEVRVGGGVGEKEVYEYGDVIERGAGG